MSQIERPHYATHLTDQFGLVDQQLQNGLYVLKRAIVFLKKVNVAHTNCAAELNKATKNESLKISAMEKDSMTPYVAAVLQLQTVMKKHIDKHILFSAQVNDGVIKPLTEFHARVDKQRIELGKKEAKCRSSMEKVYAKQRKARVDSLKQWETLQKLHKDMQQQEKNSPKHQKMQISLVRQVEKCQKCFLEFERSTVEAHKAGTIYFSHDAPKLLAQMEDLEVSRANQLKISLTHFAQLYEVWDEPVQAGTEYAQLVDQLDLDSALSQSIHHAVITAGGFPKGPPSLGDALPCPSSAFADGSWLTPSPFLMPKFDVKPPTSYQLAENKAQKSISPSDPVTANVNVVESEEFSPTELINAVEGESKEQYQLGGELLAPGGPPMSEMSGNEHPQAEEGEEGEEAEPQYCIGIYAYNTDHVDDLKFTVGEVIRLLSPNVDFSSHDPANPVWLLGELRDDPDATGSFPSNYVKPCDVEGNDL